MKTKITKIQSAKNLVERIAGQGIFRITGPCPTCGHRVSFNFIGTRKQAETTNFPKCNKAEHQR